MTTTATLQTSSNGQAVTATITDEAGTVETFTVKDGAHFLSALDRNLSDLMWNRSAFSADMSATLTRPAVYTLLTKVNA